MEPDESANFDQTLARMREGLPAMWFALYSGMVDKGFTPKQAIKLLKTFIKSSSIES